jgi:hypothetical protein
VEEHLSLSLVAVEDGREGLAEGPFLLWV